MSKVLELKRELDHIIPTMQQIVNTLDNQYLVLNDIEERLLAYQLYAQANLLREVIWEQEYINGEVRKEEILKKRSLHFLKGNFLELKVWDEDTESWEWIQTRIEYEPKSNKFYAAARPELILDGITARKRIVKRAS